MCADIKDNYIATSMDCEEYMQGKYRRFPQEIRERYNLQDILTQEKYTNIKIKRGIYDLSQVAILAYDHL